MEEDRRQFVRRAADRERKRITRDTVFAAVGLALLIYTALGQVPHNVAPTMVLIAGSLCGVPVFLGALEKRDGKRW